MVKVGFVEICALVEAGSAEVGARGEDDPPEINACVETCVAKESLVMKFDTTELDVLVETGKSEVGVPIQMKLFESDAF
jgi:hypothetical protein